jgi:hypothetical protein
VDFQKEPARLDEIGYQLGDFQQLSPCVVR